MPRSDLPASIGLILFGAAVAFESWRMPRFESIGGHPYSAPGLVPGILGAVIALLGTLMLIRYLFYLRRPAQPPASIEVSEASLGDLAPDPSDRASDASMETPGGDDTLAKPSNARLLWTMGLSIVFAAFMVGNMPFWLATFLFVFVFIVVFEWTKLKDRRSTVVGLVTAGAIAGAAAFAVPFVFERVFLVNLP